MSNFDCMYYEKAMPDTFCDHILENLNWSEAANAAVHKSGEDVQFNEWRKAEIISDSLMSPLGSIAKNYLIEGNRLGQWTGTICDFDRPRRRECLHDRLALELNKRLRE